MCQGNANTKQQCHKQKQSAWGCGSRMKHLATHTHTRNIIISKVHAVQLVLGHWGLMSLKRFNQGYNGRGAASLICLASSSDIHSTMMSEACARCRCGAVDEGCCCCCCVSLSSAPLCCRVDDGFGAASLICLASSSDIHSVIIDDACTRGRYGGGAAATGGM